jgi:hypothetical protein
VPEADEREGVAAKLAKMSFPQRLKAAIKGSKEMRRFSSGTRTS